MVHVDFFFSYINQWRNWKGVVGLENNLISNGFKNLRLGNLALIN
jgi:hypothetical protein